MLFANLLLIVSGLVAFCFVFVLLFGAPFLPTLSPQVVIALKLLDLKPGETMLELGCGDGRVLIAAAKAGINVVGYELNPIMVIISLVRTWKYRERVHVIWGDFWLISWPPAQGVFGFILPRYMSKLHKKILQYPHRPLKVASFAFAIPDLQPVQVQQGVFLYEYKSADFKSAA